MSLSKYSKMFDESCAEWTKDGEYNLLYLRSTQQYFNDLLRCKKYVFLRDVYERLGFIITKDSIIVGWVYDENDKTKNNFIDFGLFNNNKKGANIILEFNVDGDITNNF